DSNSQMPRALVERYAVEVVPLTVTVDGEAFREGVDLDADAFYARYVDGAKPTVSTAAPSPGAFVAAYARLAERGAEEVLSVHIGAAVSATLNSARLAAGAAEVPVRLVDTGTASFAVTCCLWEAAEAVAGGADLEAAAAVAEAVAARCGNVFMVADLAFARSGGRLASDAGADGVPVLTMVDGVMEVIATVGGVEEAADAMAAHVLAGGTGLRVGVAVADEATASIAEALERRLAGRPEIADVVRYRVGPSVGVHTGPGTSGAMFYSSAAAG
ncbi:MAG: DegV family protein, partial [Acidimicrobiales bacterium]